jgi:lipopolysaccharide transport system ATP-binding protein
MFSRRRRSGDRAHRDTTVRAEGLGKKYFKRATAGAAERRQDGDAFWALRDVSFELKQGDVLGIIGRNGSGKSTLLKILSSITPPSEGSVAVSGRVGSLLEVGTGFHPDLSGRENIMLAGSLLGIGRPEVQANVDRIIDFSGIGEFIDVPVKRYSSGMYVRLAYSVSALLRSDVLILDEVLSVGDAEFQKKTRSHVESIARDGRTVLFVSHTMESVQKFCDWCLWLDGGRVKEFGPVGETTSHYIEAVGSDGHPEDLSTAPATLDLTVGKSFYPVREHRVLTSITTRGANGAPTRLFKAGDPMTIEVGYHMPVRDAASYISLFFLWPNDDRRMVLQSGHDNALFHFFGDGRVVCSVPELRLVPGVYSIMVDYGHVDFDRFVSLDCIVDATKIRVEEGGRLALAAEVEDRGEFIQPSSWALLPA